MKWIKKGLIFEPKGNFDWMHTHAAVPIADKIKGDLYKIYFATRDKENRSHIAYIKIDIKNPKKTLYISENPVLKPGVLGTFDDSGAMVSLIVNHEGEKYLYYAGWNLGVTVPFRNSIGLAISQDGGKTFNKYSKGPILDRNILEPYFVGNPSVIIDGNVWKMWYLSCVKWIMENNKPKHYYHIKYAESKDGIDWIRKGIVCIDFKSKDEYAISRPCVIKENSIYKMWYSYRGESYRIGYAESTDGLQWERKDEEAGIDVSDSGWDSEMIEYPFVFDHKGCRYMLYNGNGYGKTGIGLAVLSKEE
ncbi:hypothetical protein KAU11_07585 [Candidatus Babeliales bacterium]|nr:hypothetical protein [Candidatus Babeliales bacterium]